MEQPLCSSKQLQKKEMLQNDDAQIQSIKNLDIPPPSPQPPKITSIRERKLRIKSRLRDIRCPSSSNTTNNNSSNLLSSQTSTNNDALTTSGVYSSSQNDVKKTSHSYHTTTIPPLLSKSSHDTQNTSTLYSNYKYASNTSHQSSARDDVQDIPKPAFSNYLNINYKQTPTNHNIHHQNHNRFKLSDSKRVPHNDILHDQNDDLLQDQNENNHDNRETIPIPNYLKLQSPHSITHRTSPPSLFGAVMQRATIFSPNSSSKLSLLSTSDSNKNAMNTTVIDNNYNDDNDHYDNNNNNDLSNNNNPGEFQGRSENLIKSSEHTNILENHFNIKENAPPILRTMSSYDEEDKSLRRQQHQNNNQVKSHTTKASTAIRNTTSRDIENFVSNLFRTTNSGRKTTTPSILLSSDNGNDDINLSDCDRRKFYLPYRLPTTSSPDDQGTKHINSYDVGKTDKTISPPLQVPVKHNNDVNHSNTKKAAPSTPSRNTNIKLTTSLSSPLRTPIKQIPSLAASSTNVTISTPKHSSVNHITSTPVAATTSISTPISSSLSYHLNIAKSTPSSHKSNNHRNHHYNLLNSPGGLTLLRVLEKCHSPIVNWPENSKSLSQNIIDNEGEKSHGSAQGVISDWQDCWIKFTSASLLVNNHFHSNDLRNDDVSSSRINPVHSSMGICDWSIKKMMRIECHPINSVPGCYTDNDCQRTFNNTKINAIAHHLFIHGEEPSLLKFYSEDQLNLARWEASTMYWQYPGEVCPLPAEYFENMQQKHTRLGTLNRSSSLNEKSNQSSRKRKWIDSIGSSDHGSNKFKDERKELLVKSIKGAPLVFQRYLKRLGKNCFGGFSHNDKNLSGNPVASFSSALTIFEQRKREWRECFRSMFHSWLNRLEEIESDINNNQSDILEVNEKVARCYFYALSHRQTILFKGSVHSDHSSSSEAIRIEPMIIFSSSDINFRNSLREMGVTFKILGKKWTQKQSVFVDQESNTFTENIFEAWMTDSNQDVKEENTSLLHEDLEALRRASANGETVGAEVSISFRKKTRKKITDKFISPLYIAGYDDCMSFFEFYFNTYGGQVNMSLSHVVEDDESSFDDLDVPLLLCRSLGPCVHTTLKKLSVLSHNLNNDVERSKCQSNQEHHDHSTLELRGPILPCAAVDLICTSASHLLRDSLRKNLHEISETSTPLKRNNDMDNHSRDSINSLETSLGSHYFVLQMSVYDVDQEKNTPLSRLRKTGLASSSLFNGKKWESGMTITNPSINDNSDNIQECREGETIGMVVWENKRPTSIAFKANAASNGIKM